MSDICAELLIYQARHLADVERRHRMGLISDEEHFDLTFYMSPELDLGVSLGTLLQDQDEQPYQQALVRLTGEPEAQDLLMEKACTIVAAKTHFVSDDRFVRSALVLLPVVLEITSIKRCPRRLPGLQEKIEAIGLPPGTLDLVFCEVLYADDELPDDLKTIKATFTLLEEHARRGALDAPHLTIPISRVAAPPAEGLGQILCWLVGFQRVDVDENNDQEGGADDARWHLRVETLISQELRASMGHVGVCVGQLAFYGYARQHAKHWLEARASVRQ